MWYWLKDRQLGQGNRNNIYGQFIFDKGAMKILWGNTVLPTNGTGTTGYPYIK